MATKEPLNEKIQESSSLSEEVKKSPYASDKNMHKQSPEEIQTEIHENLSKSVKLFSYWARNIGDYISNIQEIDKLKQEIALKQELIKEKSQTRRSTQKQTDSLRKGLSAAIKKFNGEKKKQSQVIKRFFKECKEPDKELCLEDFNDITEEKISNISDKIKPDLVNIQRKTFNRHMKCLIKLITDYRETIKSDDLLEKEIDLKEEEIEEIETQILEIERLEYNTESKNKYPTNFVAAEMGFLIEVQDEDTEVQDKDNVKSHTEYYSYPVTLKNKNTFSIYDLQDEKGNYFFVKNKNVYHGNKNMDDFIEKHNIGKGKKRSNSLNHYHSESALFFLCQDDSFQEEMINKLIKDLEENHYKLTKFEKLILEIHSTNYMCRQCFQKAEYLLSWNELNQEKQKLHFLKPFKDAFSKMLEKDKVLDPKSVLDFKVEIRISCDEAYSKARKKSPPYFIRIENDDNNFLCYHKELSKYSIIVSEGAANAHRNYSYAYNKAVQE